MKMVLKIYSILFIVIYMLINLGALAYFLISGELQKSLRWFGLSGKIWYVYGTLFILFLLGVPVFICLTRKKS